MIKLTVAQDRVIELIMDGAEHECVEPDYWFRSPNGKSEYVRKKTTASLCGRGLLEPYRKVIGRDHGNNLYGLKQLRLTPAGLDYARSKGWLPRAENDRL